MAHATAHTDDLNAVIAELLPPDLLAGVDDEIIEEKMPAEAAPVIESDMQPALIDGEDADAIAAAMAELEGGAVEPEIEVAPTKAEAKPEAEPKKKGGKKKAEKKAEGEGEPAAPAEPKAPRVTYVSGKASDVLTARVGGSVSEVLILEMADLSMEPEALAAKQSELLGILNARPHQTSNDEASTQKKVAEKIVQLFAWMKNGGKLNEVMRRTFTVLCRDGFIQSGDKGNIHAELLAKPYSVGTARAQAGQMLQMLPMLKITVPGEQKGQLKLNPDSFLMVKIRADLGL